MTCVWMQQTAGEAGAGAGGGGGVRGRVAKTMVRAPGGRRAGVWGT